MNEKSRILIVEDEPSLRDGLNDLLTMHSHQVDTAADGNRGLELALQGYYDLVLLDIMLPGVDGYEICRQLRSRNQQTGVIIVSARNTQEEKELSFELGADDFVAKPFSPRELVLRVQAILKRLKGDSLKREEITLAADLILHPSRLELRNKAESIVLSRKELDLLLYLFNHHHRAVSRGELLSAVWGYKRGGAVETRTVDIHIAKLRKKIEVDSQSPTLIVTVRSGGYQWCMA